MLTRRTLPRVLLVTTALLLIAPCVFVAYQQATPQGLFRRVVAHDLPKSLTNLRVQGHDWFGIAPEPVVWMQFSASADDLNNLLTVRRAVILEGEAIGSGASGAAWWPSQPALQRMKGFSLKGRKPEFIWIDSTGTNAFYLLFGV